MKPGTPGFIGARLIEAREARGLTATDLAELLGVSRQSIHNYEHDKQKPHPDIFALISSKLNLPSRFFLQTGSNDDAPVFFRTLSSTSASERTKARRKLFWLSRIMAHAVQYVDNWPQLNLPPIAPPHDPLSLTDEQIEQYAEETRAHWKKGTGPINNVVWMLEGNGICTARMLLQSDKMNGFSRWVDGKPLIILAADKDCAARSRFDAAHELAHLLLHQHIDAKRLAQLPHFNLIEKQAHRFAGALLLPAKSFAEDITVPSLEHFRVLKEKWKCSIALMIMRAEQLGFITEERKSALFISYTRRGWKRREPLDDTLPVEQPSILSKAFEIALETTKSVDDVVDALPYARTDIEQLAGLPTGFLSKTQATVIDLRPSMPKPTASEESRQYAREPAAILQFPRLK